MGKYGEPVGWVTYDSTAGGLDDIWPDKEAAQHYADRVNADYRYPRMRVKPVFDHPAAKLEGLVEAVRSLKRNARHMNSLGTEWKVSGDDLAAVEVALAAFEKGESDAD